MKGFTYLSLVRILSLGLFGCSSRPTTNISDSNIKEEQPKVEEKLNTKILDGLTLTSTSKIETVKGDRTQDNVANT